MTEELPSNFEILTPAQAAPILGLRWSDRPADRVSFYHAVHGWNIPHLKMGAHTVRFTRGDLRAWLDSRRVGKGAQP